MFQVHIIHRPCCENKNNKAACIALMKTCWKHLRIPCLLDWLFSEEWSHMPAVCCRSQLCVLEESQQTTFSHRGSAPPGQQGLHVTSAKNTVSHLQLLVWQNRTRSGFPQKSENRIPWLFHDWFASFHDSHSHMVADMIMIVSHNMHDNHKLESCHSHEKQFHDFWGIVIFQDFPWQQFFSRIFHDRGNPDAVLWLGQWKDIIIMALQRASLWHCRQPHCIFAASLCLCGQNISSPCINFGFSEHHRLNCKEMPTNPSTEIKSQKSRHLTHYQRGTLPPDTLGSIWKKTLPVS